MSQGPQSHRQYQYHQPNTHPETRNRQRPENALEHRREFLWRERVKLEMQVHALLALLQSIEQEWSVLEQRRVMLELEKPRVVVQIVLTSIAGSRYLPAERLFHYRRERLIQEEERLRQAMMRCQNDLAALQAQIEVICLELFFLS